jgi:hypothetical protein
MSIVISASSARVLSVIPAGVAAVVLVFSEASIDNLLVVIIVLPPSLISTMIVLPTGAVPTLARTAVSVIAWGIRKVAFAVPVVRAVVSSEHAIPIVTGTTHPVLRVLFVIVFVEVSVKALTPSMDNSPAAERDSVVSEAFPSSIVDPVSTGIEAVPIL